MTIEELRKQYGADLGRKKKIGHPEDDLQASCIEWFDLRYRPFAQLLFAIPNGGCRNVREARRLKAMGVRAGVLDLFLSVPRGGFHGMYLELKAGKNRMSPEQRKFKEAVLERDYSVHEIRTIEQFVEITNWYLGEPDVKKTKGE